jgi:DNA-directed RNA polymerase specialized sigma24 family protein
MLTRNDIENYRENSSIKHLREMEVCINRASIRRLAEKESEVVTALDTLPPHLNRLLTLRFIKGLPVRRVCREMYISEKTLFRWQNEAFEKLGI